MANEMNLPSGFSGLTRYHEEYKSFFSLKPAYVFFFIVAIIVLRVLLPIFFK